MNVKLYKSFFLLIVLLLPSCENGSNTISNTPGDMSAMYELNLTFFGNDNNDDMITLSWDENADISTFIVELDGEGM